MPDRRWIEYAARLGERALGTTGSNPPVGCVLVKEERVAGVGWTQPGGRPHAEAHAIAMAGESARGATAYVTLEPCAHEGRGPPCARGLVVAGVARVITAFEDPDPRTRGRGHLILRSAGVGVDIGIGTDEAWPALSGFLTRIARNRPYVTLKLALSADGKIAAAPGRRTPITGEAAKARVHLMRAAADAIMVGMGTVRADDPDLTCRLPGLEHRSPTRVVFDPELTVSRAARLIRTATAVPTWILAKHSAEIAPGVTVIGTSGLPDGLLKLAGRGINRLMVEGGARIARSLLEAGLVDELALFRSPDAIGSGGVDAFAGLLLPQVMSAFRKRAEETLGRDTLTLYEAADPSL